MVDQSSRPLSINPRKLALLLSIMVAIMPFSTDIYLSSVPQMAVSLHADIHLIEQSLSSFMFGVALGQLMGGSLSDIKGRKIIALIGFYCHYFCGFGPRAVILALDTGHGRWYGNRDRWRDCS